MHVTPPHLRLQKICKGRAKGKKIRQYEPVGRTKSPQADLRLGKNQEFTYAQFKSMPKKRRSGLVEPLLQDAALGAAELVIAHLETLEDV